MTRKNNGQPRPEKKSSQPNTGKSSSHPGASATKDETKVSTPPPSDQKKPQQPKAKSVADPVAKKENAQELPLPTKESLNTEERRSKKAIRIATLAIVLVALFAGGLVFILNQKNMQHDAQVAKLEGQIQQMESQLEKRFSTTETRLTNKANEAQNKTDTAILQQNESIKSLQVALANVKGTSSNDWLLAEADYLVKLAGRKLLLEKDVVTATHLIESADQRISELNDPNLTALRQKIAQDITTLRSVALVDKDGLVLRLIALQQQVDVMPLANAILPEAPVVEQREVSSDINDWQDNLMTSVKDFSENFITFRVREGNVIPLLSPQQHFYLKENIKGKIETAIRAVYNENQPIYQTSLQVANEWAMQFFRLDDSAVMEFEASIQQLSSLDVEVTYPVKLVSQQALSNVINERLRRRMTSMTTEEQQ